MPLRRRPGGDMDLDSLDLCDHELDEVGSQAAVLSGEPLFEFPFRSR